MNWKRNFYTLGIIFLTFFLVGCNNQGGGDSKNTSSTTKVQTSIDLSLSALYAGKNHSSKTTKATN